MRMFNLPNFFAEKNARDKSFFSSLAISPMFLHIIIIIFLYGSV